MAKCSNCKKENPKPAKTWKYGIFTVQASGNWKEWVEFLDSKRIRDDPRIVEWFVECRVMDRGINMGLSREQWFRSITRRIRNKFRQIDTTVLER